VNRTLKVVLCYTILRGVGVRADHSIAITAKRNIPLSLIPTKLPIKIVCGCLRLTEIITKPFAIRILMLKHSANLLAWCGLNGCAIPSINHKNASLLSQATSSSQVIDIPGQRKYF